MAENTEPKTEPQSAEPVISNDFPVESSVIRNLRQQIKDKDNKIQELSTSKQAFETKASEVPVELANRLEKLEFDQFINAKPNLVEKKEEIWNTKSANPGLSVEDATALVLGKSILSAVPAPQAPMSFNSNVNITPNISDLASKSDEELASLAMKELEGIN